VVTDHAGKQFGVDAAAAMLQCGIMADTYRELHAWLVETAVLGSTASLLGWDELTYMPPKGADGRARQMSLLSRMCHEQFTQKKVGQQLGELMGQKVDEDAAANVREWKRAYDRAVKVPASLVEEIARSGVIARQAWGEARGKSEYAIFKPHLARTIELQRQLAACLCGHQPTSADEQYDVLLDAYEPYETSANLRVIFGQLREQLVPLIARVRQSGKVAPVEILKRPYPVEKQRELSLEAAKRIGFDLQAGRLDTTLHPFCSGITPGDVRITTRYDENDFGNCFFSVMHETGHAMYEQGLPAEHWGTPLGDAASLGVHESQSRLWENLVCRSEAFWRFFYPKAQAAFSQALGNVPADQFLFAVNAIRPSLIRTESDEATYNLHVILRFGLEQRLLWGELPVDGLPEAWNKGMKEMLGVEVPDDRRGCLQDVHWSQGAFGYFPTYTLGNLNAAALFTAARRDLGDLDGQIARGEFAPLLAWLRERIHRHGKRYPARELVRRAAGQELSIAPLLAHLKARIDRFW